MSKVERTDGSVLGCLRVGQRLVTAVLALAVVFSSCAAWALNYDKTIQTQGREAAQILKTLGRGKKVNSEESRYKKKKKVYVQLIKRNQRRI